MTSDARSAREALERRLADALTDPTPATFARAREAVRDLTPGAWTPRLLDRARAHVGRVPPGPVGSALFPAVGRDRVVEVRVDVAFGEGRAAPTTDASAREDSDLADPSGAQADDCEASPGRDPDEPSVEGAGSVAREAVREAVRAARAWVGGRDVSPRASSLVVRFHPDAGWEGASCGLAVALATVSALCGRPLAPAVWATGRVTADGRVHGVGQLPPKRAASEGRRLLEPLADDVGAAGSIGVGTLEAAVEAARADPDADRLRTLRAGVDAWLGALGWTPERHVPTEADAAVLSWWQGSGSTLAITGPAGAGSSWRLARLVASVREAASVLVVDGLQTRDAAGLARNLARALGPPASGPQRPLETWLACLHDLARAAGRPALLVVHAADATLVPVLLGAGGKSIRVVWSERAEARDGEGGRGDAEVHCRGDLLAEAWPDWVRARLPAAAWTPVHRATLETLLGVRAAPLLRHWPWTSAPLLRGDLLGAVLVDELQRAGARGPGTDDVLASLGAHLLERPETPWRPRRLLPAARMALVALEAAQLVTATDTGLVVRGTSVREALRVRAAQQRVAGGLPEPRAWLRGRAREGGRPWSPWDEVLIRACLESRGRTEAVRWASAVGDALRAGSARGRAGRAALLALATAVGRAELLRETRGAPLLVALHDACEAAAGLGVLVVSGFVLTTVYDDWPLGFRRAGRARALCEALLGAPSLGHGDRLALRLLTRALDGDGAGLVSMLPANPCVSLDDSRAWLPILHVVLLERGWPTRDGADVDALQETVCEAWWRRMMLASTRLRDPARAADAREEAVLVAESRYHAARALADATREARWTERRVPGVVVHGLDGDAERGIARGVYLRVAERRARSKRRGGRTPA